MGILYGAFEQVGDRRKNLVDMWDDPMEDFFHMAMDAQAIADRDLVEIHTSIHMEIHFTFFD